MPFQSTSKRVLIVEDDAGLAELLSLGLSDRGFTCEVLHSARGCLARLAAGPAPDLLLVDYSLPDLRATALVDELMRAGRLPPFLVITGHGDERVAVQLMKQGALDYLVKDVQLLDRLPLIVARVFQELETERRLAEAEQALRESEEKYQALFAAISDAVYVHEVDEGGYPTAILEVNQVACRMLGYSREELLKMRISDVDAPESVVDVSNTIARIKLGNDVLFEQTHVAKDGARIPVEIHAQPFHYQGRIAILSTARDIRERKRAEAAAQKSQAELEAIYDSSPLMMCLVNRQREVERLNRAMAEFVGLDAVSSSLQHPGDLLGCVNALDDPKGCGYGQQCVTCPMRVAVLKTFETAQPCRQVESSLFLVRAGYRREIQVNATTSLVKFGAEFKVLVCLEDITARKELQAQFLQAQKMDAIGQLAGGVAHDFNNILATILLHLHLLQEKEGRDQETAQALQELQRSAQRAASLTRQLLLFSRRQVMQPKLVDLSEIVAEMTKMLQRLLGEHITLVLERAAESVWLNADPGMLEQVVMNLCVNARDAMPKGGLLTVRTSLERRDSESLGSHPEARAGCFACLSVTDTGCGMDEATMRRIFEPFFTTKEAGKGTGLGLATVHTVTRQHQGWIEVESTVNGGTTFRVFLPAAEKPVFVETPVTEDRARGGNETILLVEDDETVRGMVQLVLVRQGYEVLAAPNGREALRLWEQHRERIQLLFTDMVMPEGLTGLDLTLRLREFKPDLKVIISSGYSADLLHHQGKLPPGIQFLAKPYTPAALSKTIREYLDEKPPESYASPAG